MKRQCERTNSEFEISDFELDFCQRESIPLPVIAPHERLREMLAFRNRINLFHNICAGTGKRIISAFDPRSALTIVDVDYWESDAWNPHGYGLEFNPNRSAFEQITQLISKVPLPNLAVIKSTMENSDYANGVTSAKNCYLAFAISRCEECFYSRNMVDCKNVVDTVLAQQFELCFDCRAINNCYELKFSEHCFQCANAAFLSNCQSCNDCFMCANLTNKRYCFRNQQFSAEEYKRAIADYDLGNYSTVCRLKEEFKNFSVQFPIKFAHGRNNELSTGNYLNNTKRCFNSFFVGYSEDVEHSIWVNRTKTSLFHCMYGEGSELIYNCVTSGDNSYNLKFCVECWKDVSDLEYCIYCCHGCRHCFGCVGLRRASYCIFNRQYSKEEYFSVVAQVKAQMLARGEYGRFFPQCISPVAYNHSEADTYFPLPKTAALAAGFRWSESDDENAESGVAGAIDATRLPICIDEAGDNLLNQEIVCASTHKRFRLNRSELEFYRRLRLPLPRLHPLVRIRNNSEFLRIDPLRESACSACHEPIVTSYDAARRSVLCERCYQESIC